MRKQVAYNDKDNTMIITPGFGGDVETVMDHEDFLNICSDFAFQELQSPRFDDFVRRYFDNKEDDTEPIIKIIRGDKNEDNEKIN